MLEDPYEYEPQPRLRFRPWMLLAWLVLVLAGIGSLAYCNVAIADEPKVTFVAEMGENKLFIFQEPCALGGWFATWRKARWIFKGKTFEACWKLQHSQDGIYVHTVDAAGDTGTIPVGAFRKQEMI